MILILLVFFLVTSFVIRMPFQERGVYIPTPENTRGRAQVVMQLLDENHFIWIDDSFGQTVERITKDFGYLSQARLTERIINEMINESQYEMRSLDSKISELQKKAGENQTARYFVQIRCPNEIPYYRVIHIINKLNQGTFANIRYGCVGGTIGDMASADRIRIIQERDEQGRLRKNILIDF